jgi:hypothetical protein
VLYVRLLDALGNAISLGQSTKSGSIPVTLASDQGSLTVADSALSAVTAVVNALSPSSLLQVGGWIFGSSKARGLEIDWNNGLHTIDASHHEIHEGYSFTARDAVQTLSSSASRDILITVGTGAIHAIPLVEASLSGRWYLYRGPTVTSNGAAVVARNRYDGSLTASTTAVYGGPTITGTGTEIDGGLIGGGSSSSRTGGNTSSRSSEWVLAAGTSYLLRFTADANSTVARLGVDWYSAHDANGGHVL